MTCAKCGGEIPAGGAVCPRCGEIPAGTRVGGRYEVERRLGNIGRGAAYLGWDTRPPRAVMLKFPDPEAMERFRREAEVTAGLNHQNILRVFEAGEWEGTPFLALEFCEGGTLGDRGKLEVEEARELMWQVGQALAHAHRRDAIHGDVRPANILLTKEGVPKLGDFGPAKGGAPQADHRTDIHSWGATFYQLVTGKEPPPGDPGEIPAPVERVIRRCLKGREERYFSMDEALQALEEAPAAEGGCPHCGHPGPPSARFCKDCGAGLIETCPDCGSEGRAPIRLCGKCGCDARKRRKFKDHMAQAENLLEARRFPQAVRELEEAAALYPGSEEAGKRLEEARRRAASLDALRLRMEASRKAGIQEMAAATAREILGIDPDDEEAKQVVAAKAPALKRHEETAKPPAAAGRAAWKRRVALTVVAATVAILGVWTCRGMENRGKLGRAAESIEEGRFEEAQGMLRDMRGGEKRVAGLLELCGSALRAKGLEAEGRWREAMEEWNETARRGAALGMEGLEKFRQAADAGLERAYGEAMAKAEELRLAEHWEEARKEVEEALRIKPGDRKARELKRDIGALEADSRYQEALGRARRHWEEGMYEEASAACEEALQFAPGDVEASRMKSEADEKKGKEDRWEAWYQEAMKAGNEAMRKGEWDRAVGEFDKALRSVPGDAEASRWKAEAEKKKEEDGKKKREARYREAMEAGNDAARKGEWERAVDEFDRARKARPEDREALRRMMEAAEKGEGKRKYSEAMQDGEEAEAALEWGRARRAYEEALKWKAGDAAAQAGLERAKTPPKLTVVLDPAKDLRMEFVRVPAGRFRMGSDEFHDEKPAHGVEITKDFWMAATEVTQAQWEGVTGDNPSCFKGAGRPVEQVSWRDGEGFVNQLNDRYKDQTDERVFGLPTEAEWEYACRAGSWDRWSFGNDGGRSGEHAWHDANSGGTTHAVGGKKPNKWGLYDMHGNVWEWCRDWYGPYAAAAQKDPQGASSGRFRVLRGGSWHDDAKGIRSAGRLWGGSAERGNLVGLRPVLR